MIAFLRSFRKSRHAHDDPKPRLAEVEAAKAAARADFERDLRRLLDRPGPASMTCFCCDQSIAFKSAVEMPAKCMFTGVSLVRHKCGTCGCVIGPMPLVQCTPAELGGLYQGFYRFCNEGFSVPYQEKTFYLLNPSRRGKYLNYACGDWVVGVKRLRDIGWDVWGYEPFQDSKSPAIFAERSQVIDGSYDGVFSHNYIEHVQDPVAFFRECRAMLKEKAAMAHSSPCYEYLYEVSPFHLFFPTGDSVHRLAAKTGFRVAGMQGVDVDWPGNEYYCCNFAAI